MSDAAAEAKAAVNPSGMAHGLFEGLGEFVDIVFDVIVPIIAVIAGFLLALSIGLSGMFHALFFWANIPGFTNTNLEALVDGLLAAGIWGMAGLSVWKAASRMKNAGRWIARSFGGFFVGMALREAVTGFSGQFAMAGILPVLVGELGTETQSIPGGGPNP